MPTASFYYEFQDNQAFTKEEFSEGAKLLKNKFPSANITKGKRSPWNHNEILVEYKKSDIKTLNKVIEKEVLGSMKNTDELRGKFMPSFRLNNGRRMSLYSNIEFLIFEGLSFTRHSLKPAYWDDWVEFVELSLVENDLKKIIQKKKDITNGDKILTLLKEEPAQALLLLEVVQNDLTKAELGVIAETIHNRARVLGNHIKVN